MSVPEAKEQEKRKKKQMRAADPSLCPCTFTTLTALRASPHLPSTPPKHESTAEDTAKVRGTLTGAAGWISFFRHFAFLFLLTQTLGTLCDPTCMCCSPYLHPLPEQPSKLPYTLFFYCTIRHGIKMDTALT